MEKRWCVYRGESLAHHKKMKVITALVALTLTTAPAFASCSTANFIQAAGQTVCIRQMQGEELKIALQQREARNHERYKRKQAAIAAQEAKQHEQSRAAAATRNLENTRELGRQMDTAVDRISEPGGRERYRDAINAYTDSAVRDYQYQHGF